MTLAKPVAELIEKQLTAAFHLRMLRIEDESESHRGHAGFQEGGESHFHIALAADELDPLSRIARHRAVHAALGEAVISRIHALRLTISTD